MKFNLSYLVILSSSLLLFSGCNPSTQAAKNLDYAAAFLGTHEALETLEGYSIESERDEYIMGQGPEPGKGMMLLAAPSTKVSHQLPSQSIKIDPDYAEAYYNLGITLTDLGKFEQAELIFKQTIVLNPDLAEAHYNLGKIFVELKQLDSALVSYDKAIILKKDFDNAIAGVGDVLMRKGRHNEGLKKLRLANGSILFSIKNGFSVKQEV